MKTLPAPEHQWGNLGAIVSNGLYHRIFMAAIRLKIFNSLDWNTAEEIAERLKTHPRNTGLFLNVLAGLGLLIKKNGRYCNTEEGKKFLDSGSQNYLGDYFLYYSSFFEGKEGDFEALVKNGPPVDINSKDMADESIWASSAQLSAAYQYGGEAQKMAKMVSELDEFSLMKRMLDMGGGAGFYSIATISAHQTMIGVILEQPAVAEVAAGFVKEYGMEHRIDIVSGNYLEDDLGGPYDLVFAGSTLNFAKDRLEPLFRKVLNSLTPGGLFITHQDGYTDERTSPVEHISGFLGFEMAGADFAFARGEIAKAMIQSGFQSVRSFTVNWNIGPMDIDIAKKSVCYKVHL